MTDPAESETDPEKSGADSTQSEEREYNLPIVVASLVAGVFFGGVGGGVAFPTLPTLGTVLGITPFVVGLILSVNRFTSLLMNTPAGQLVDRVGTRKPMIFGFFMQAISPFGYIVGLYPERVPVLDAAEIFIISRAFFGIGTAVVFVGAFGTLVHITSPENRGKWVGYFRGGQSLGVPAGLIIGGVLTDLYSYEVAFFVAGASCLLAAVVAAIVLPDVVPDVHQPARLREVPRIVRADPRILAIGSVNFTVRFLFIGVFASTIVLYADVHGIGIGSFSALGASGILLAVGFAFSSGTTVFSGNLSDKVDNRALVAVPALALFAFGFVLLGILPTLLGTVVGIALIGIGVGGTNPPMLAYLGDISPDADVGKMGGVYNVFGDLGGTLGPIVALPLAAMIGYRAEYLACAGLILVLIVLVVRTLLGTPEEDEELDVGVRG